MTSNQFLQFDSGPDEQRMLIFATPDQLGILAECDEMLIDGIILQNEQNYIRCHIVKINAGQNAQQSKIYLDYSERLKTLLIR